MAGRTARRAWSAQPRSRHFLRPRFAAEIVRGAAVSRDELVVDIGAGSGRLTAEIARVARRVLAVELDARLASALRGRWPNVAVVEGDATAMALPREPFRVIANLPFARTNELLRLLFDDPKTPLTRADLVVEWGVAIKRAVPWPSSARSVIWSATYEAVLARRLPRAPSSRRPRSRPASSCSVAVTSRSFVQKISPPSVVSSLAAFATDSERWHLPATAASQLRLPRSHATSTPMSGRSSFDRRAETRSNGAVPADPVLRFGSLGLAVKRSRKVHRFWQSKSAPGLLRWAGFRRSGGAAERRSLSGGRDVEPTLAEPVALAFERDHGGVVDEPVIRRAEVVALLFNLSDIASSLEQIERLLGEDDGQEEDDAS